MLLTETLDRLRDDVDAAQRSARALQTLATQDAPLEPSVVLVDLLADEVTAAADALRQASVACTRARAAAAARDVPSLHAALVASAPPLSDAAARLRRQLTPPALVEGLLDLGARPGFGPWAREAVCGLTAADAAVLDALLSLVRTWEDLADRLVDRLAPPIVPPHRTHPVEARHA